MKFKWSNFNPRKFRRDYDDMSFVKLKKLYDRVMTAKKNRKHYNLNAVKRFFNMIYTNPKVIEVGGWNGRLASDILKENKEILYWDNYELSKYGKLLNICEDDRYDCVELKKQVWELPIWDKYDTCVLSHVLEHVKFHEARKLFDKFDNIKYIYIEAPIKRGRQNWKNHKGVHIIERGWNTIGKILKDKGFKEIFHNRHVRFYIG